MVTDQEDYETNVIGLSRGKGDPDHHGYPGEPEAVATEGSVSSDTITDIPF